MSRRSPPRYVPTLTHVVTPGPDTGEEPPRTPVLAQEQLIARVMERVDASLERRLREAVAAIVIEQTRSLGPLLRDEIEAVVRQAVTDALEAELRLNSEPPR